MKIHQIYTPHIFVQSRHILRKINCEFLAPLRFCGHFKPLLRRLSPHMLLLAKQQLALSQLQWKEIPGKLMTLQSRFLSKDDACVVDTAALKVISVRAVVINPQAKLYTNANA